MRDYNTNANRRIIIEYYNKKMEKVDAIKKANEFFDNPSSFNVEEFKKVLALLEPKKLAGKKPKVKA